LTEQAFVAIMLAWIMGFVGISFWDLVGLDVANQVSLVCLVNKVISVEDFEHLFDYFWHSFHFLERSRIFRIIRMTYEIICFSGFESF
jgi:hypothetical protein